MWISKLEPKVGQDRIGRFPTNKRSQILPKMIHYEVMKSKQANEENLKFEIKKRIEKILVDHDKYLCQFHDRFVDSYSWQIFQNS